jgi:segregation and condensation protein A
MRIDLPAFSGPLELLLHLIEREELDITAISLARVAEQYLAQIEQLKADRIDELIDFLVIGARLALIKSRALLPRPPSPTLLGEEEEDPATALARQLRAYRRFKSAARWLGEREVKGLRVYYRLVTRPRAVSSRLDLTGVTTGELLLALQNALARRPSASAAAEAIIAPAHTIEGQMALLRRAVARHQQVGFAALLSARPSSAELAATLLALLELVKRQEVEAHQDHLFGPIAISGRQASA